MKRNYSLILFAFVFAGIALLSCSREDAKIIPTENQGDIPTSQIVGKKTKITLKGHKASDDMTKTILSGSNLKSIDWMPHEKINVFYNSHSYKFISENEEQTNDMVNFVGVITKVSHKDGEEPKYGDIIALYPYDKKATIDTTNNANVISTSLPAFQMAKDNSFADSLFISMAKGEIYSMNEDGDVANGDLYFYNVGSGFCFSVTHNDIVAVELEGLNDEYLAGDFKVKFEEVDGIEIPVVQEVTKGQKTITVVAPNGTFTPGVQYYAVTLPISFSNGVIVTALREDGKGYETQITKAGGVNFKRAVFARKLNVDSGKNAEDIFNYTFEGTSPDEFMFAAGERDYTVKSYRTRISTGKTQPMAWKVQVSTDGGANYSDLTDDNKAALGVQWLTFSPNGAINSTTAAETFKISAEEAEIDTETLNDAETQHTQALKNALAENVYEGASSNMSGKAAAIDLSLYDAHGKLIPGGRSTANCYVVRAPGWYKIPLVYGNMIKHGTINKSSYLSLQGDSYNRMLDEFVILDEYGPEGIFCPISFNPSSSDEYTDWIAKRRPSVIPNSYPRDSVALIWQDSENLIKASDVVIRRENPTANGSWYDYDHFIYFFVSKNTIKQGNAVIGLTHRTSDIEWYDPSYGPKFPEEEWGNVRNTRYCVWSWHIWVTDEDLTSVDVTNATGNTYQFMPVNLGWCTVGDRIDYKSRSAKIRICQVGSGYHKDFDVIQNGKIGIEPSGNNPYYQWGRKDPQLPATGFGNEAKDYWGIYGKNDGSSYAIASWLDTRPGNGRFNALWRLALYIAYPHRFNITKSPSGVVGMENRFANLWSINTNQLSGNTGTGVLNANNEVVVKTIYDPCPYGYTVPASGAFTGFTSATVADKVGQGGANTEIASGFKNGFYFYTSPAKDKTIFMPLTGIRRQSNGSWAAYGEDGYYWTAHASYSGSGYSFQFGSVGSSELVSGDNYDDGTNYALLRTNFKGTGYSIRPVVDKSL